MSTQLLNGPKDVFTPELDSEVISKIYGDRELKGNLENALKTIRRNDEISKNFPKEANNQYKV